MQNKHYCAISMLTRTSCFRAGRKRTMRMIHLQVVALHGLGNNFLPGVLEGTGMAIEGHGTITEMEVFNHDTMSYLSGDPEFFEDDFDVETIFRSAFGGNRHFYWSFINEENPQWRRSGGYSNFSRSWNWRHESEDEYDSSTESGSSGSDLVSDRLALGLSAYGPLKAEDVKNAYRACALKWHPDRHQGSSKVVAEEKFKVCSAAYQSLCDKLPIN